MELTNQFKEGCVHIWQGSADRVLPNEFNHYIIKKLPWIRYHEVPNAGHLLVHDHENFEAIMRSLLNLSLFVLLLFIVVEKKCKCIR